ncbi:MAG: YolD-like family protein [Acutalibacteraceae bacterium]
MDGFAASTQGKGKLKVPRKEISEDMADEIDRNLKALEKGKIVTVVWYNEFERNYIQLTGEVKGINPQKKYIQIETIDIFFDDIYSIQKN